MTVYPLNVFFNERATMIFVGKNAIFLADLARQRVVNHHCFVLRSHIRYLGCSCVILHIPYIYTYIYTYKNFVLLAQHAGYFLNDQTLPEKQKKTCHPLLRFTGSPVQLHEKDQFWGHLRVKSNKK